MAPKQKLELWPGRPSPKKGESFSSWFTRIAHANALEPKTLYAALFPGARLHSLDIDRWGEENLFEILQAGTGRKRANFTKMTLTAYQGRVYEDSNPKAPLMWIPQVGGPGRRSFGQRACPKCLQEGVSYFRLKWRLSFIAACSRHRIELIDRCHDCGAGIVPTRTRPREGFVCCHVCGADLREAPAASVDIAGLELQQKIWTAAEQGWATIGDATQVHSLAYFWMLRKLYKLVVTGEFALPIREHVLNKVDWPVAAMSIPRLKEIDRLPPGASLLAFRFADYLLSDWPRRFIDACKVVGATKRRLIREEETAPFAFVRAVEAGLTSGTSTVAPDQIERAAGILSDSGLRPTYKNVSSFLGNRIHAHRSLSAPARICKPYGTDRYWKLDGVAPDTRAAAKAAARQAGLNVGPWVDWILKKALENSI